MRSFLWFVSILLACTLSQIVLAQAKSRSVAKSSSYSVPLALHGSSQLRDTLNAIISNSNSQATISVYVKSMKRGDALYTRNIHDPMVPASTMKVLTAEAALLFLGPEYRFSTQVLTDAKGLKDGELQGNLYIVLSGDPTLTYFDLVDLLLMLKSQQIDRIAGNVYIDNTAYDQRFYGPGWDVKDRKYCYSAPISASIINHNCLALKVTPNKNQGSAAQVITSPNYFYPTIQNGVVTKKQRTRNCRLNLTTNPRSMITIDGCMPKGDYAWGLSYVVTDIPEYNRALFKNLLNRLSIRIVGNVTFGTASDKLSLIGQHASKPLRLLVNDMLKKSDNIIAGALFKKIGQLYSHSPGSWENGSLAVSKILSKHASVNIDGLRVLDGSGLSPYNLTSSAQMMQVLDFAFHHAPISYEFITALPIAGVDGTLKHRMANIARRVRAKTGTISGVVSLAGYVSTAEQEPLAFVIIINGNKKQNWKYREMEDSIATTLTRYRRGG